MATIVFFEDEEKFANETVTQLQKRLKAKAYVKRFVGEEVGTAKDHPPIPYLQRIETALQSETYRDVSMIVTDVNLAELDGYHGLSAEVLLELGKRRSIPVCVYSRNATDQLDILARWIDGRIILESPPGSPAIFAEIASIHAGFTQLMKLTTKLTSKDKSRSLPELASHILGRPQYTNRFVSYAIGNQAFYGFANAKSYQKDSAPWSDPKALSFVIGTWLLTSIFRFPGLLVNEIAAASYLDLDLPDFRKETIKKLFKKASYRGPFSELHQMWWRDELDDLLIGEEAESGYELAKKKFADVRHSTCSVDNTSPAGFYCIVTKQPVSRKNSNGEVAWIPKGADLSRISNKIMDQLSPWFATFS
jgi:hypothetical protein